MIQALSWTVDSCSSDRDILFRHEIQRYLKLKTKPKQIEPLDPI
jgi:hypothetical protein